MDARYVNVDELPIDPTFKKVIGSSGCTTFGQFVATIPIHNQDIIASRLGSKKPEFKELLRLGRTSGRAFTEHIGLEPDPLPVVNPSVPLEKMPAEKYVAPVERVRSKPLSSSAIRRNSGRSRRGYESIALLDPELHRELLALNHDAADAFRDLQFNGVTSLVSETDDKFAIEMPRIHELFQRLFSHDPNAAPRRIQGTYEEIFLVYSVYRARQTYDRRGMWYFLEDLGLTDLNHMSECKRMLYETLKRYEFPTIEAGERSYYYMYTMLLNGGLNQVSWLELWKDTVIPLLTRPDGSKETVQSLGETIKRAALAEKGDALSHFRVKDKVTRIILKEGPEVSILPLLGEAARVASEALSTPTVGIGGGRSVVLNAGSLSSLAMETLEETIQDLRERESRKTSGKRESGEDSSSPFYTREPIVRLQDGVMHVQWYAMPMPRKSIGLKVEYLVNGDLVKTTFVDPYLEKGRIEAIDLAVEDPFRDDAVSIEMRYLRKSDDPNVGEFQETGSRTYNVVGRHSQCFEFLKRANGTFQLRRDGDTLRGKGESEIAVLVKHGYELRLSDDGVVGNEVAFGDDGRGTVSYTAYDCLVTQGVSYGIRSTTSGWTVEQWNERCNVVATRTRRLGVTRDRVDVYGKPRGNVCKLFDRYTMSVRSDNPPAPDFQIYGQLGSIRTCRVSVTCDGETFEMDDAKKWLWTLEPGCLGLRMPDFLMDDMVGDCRLSIAIDGADVFAYHFVRVPIERVHLEKVESPADKRFGASYRIELSDRCLVEAMTDDGSTDIEASVRVVSECAIELRTDLELPQLGIRLRGDSGKTIAEFDVQLAGIRLRLMHGAFEQEGDLPLFYSCWSALRERRGLVRFTTAMRCRGARRITTELSGRTLATYRLGNSDSRRVNPFLDIGSEILESDWPKKGRKSLDLHLAYAIDAGDWAKETGYAARLGCLVHLCDVDLDLDLPSFKIVCKRNPKTFVSKYALVFDKPLESDLFVVFRTDRNNVSSANEFALDVERGEQTIAFPRDVAMAYDLCCDIIVTMQVPDGIDNARVLTLNQRS